MYTFALTHNLSVWIFSMTCVRTWPSRMKKTVGHEIESQDRLDCRLRCSVYCGVPIIIYILLSTPRACCSLHTHHYYTSVIFCTYHRMVTRASFAGPLFFIQKGYQNEVIFPVGTRTALAQISIKLNFSSGGQDKHTHTHMM